MSEINLEKNMSLYYLDLRGINLANWDDIVENMTSSANWDNWPIGTQSINDTGDYTNDVNQNRFNLSQCGDSGSRQTSNTNNSPLNMTIRVKNAASKSHIDTYRGNTINYAFRIPTWATVSYW
jgi:hypothetical protein